MAAWKMLQLLLRGPMRYVMLRMVCVLPPEMCIGSNEMFTASNEMWSAPQGDVYCLP